ncbi:DUF2189 domain-containing protein [Pelagibius litoralis]|uniref:DUF2189 domain-containing protein n=1 Tax=Pelagibius litoralis TaxID=374515 RepID=A0A967F0D6_9PROT|nr:DUF2189 domain-containing protein [Pelagibius litoralis]NIA70796.1 DUF2189 domain-containing protein [Pelagibius litoralis]
MHTIRNPIEWGMDALKDAAQAVEAAGSSLPADETAEQAGHPSVRKIGVADLREALAKGFSDFGAYRSDVIFLCIIYPAISLVLIHAALNYDMLALLFPLASGFALVGPVAAIGLYELSRRRERGLPASWLHAFGMVRAPSFGAIAILGLALLALFVLWLGAAQLIYLLTLGPQPPASPAAFLSDVLTTSAGWTMTLVGLGVGFLFAVVVLAISVVSFPLLLDRPVGLGIAIGTSVRAVAANPGIMALWGMIVAGALVLGSIPLFLGLVIVMPVLGHATWHLYRRVVR